jgi:hypothetical protein
VAVSAFRAIATVRWQSAISQLRKQFGVGGAWAVGGFIAVFFVFSLAPVFSFSVLAGWWTATTIDHERYSRLVSGIALLLSISTVMVAVFGTLSGQSHKLPWNSLRAFPVHSTTLFFAELFAQFSEWLTLLFLGALACFTVGVCAGAPRGTPFFLALCFTHGLVLLSLQQLLGGFSLALFKSKRTRRLIVPPLLALAVVLPLTVSSGLGNRLKSLPWGQIKEVISLLPAHMLLEGARHSAAKSVSTRDLLALLLCLLGSVAVLALAYVVVVADRAPAVFRDAPKAKKLWSFSHPVLGIARLQLLALDKSVVGQFSLYAPLMAVALVRWPLRKTLGDSAFVTPGVFAYTALSGARLLFNQFGLDRNGAKVFFLLPVSSETILKGKWLGFAAWQGLLMLILATLLFITGNPTLAPVLVGALTSLCLFLPMSALGQVSSILWPTPISRNEMQSTRPPLVMALVTTVSSAAILLCVGGVFAFTHFFAAGFEPLTLSLLAGLFFALFRLALRFNASLLDRYRERIVETLSSSST